MALENYRDLSGGGSDISAGFQFEFACACCGKKWKSQFKPYRIGQVTGFLSRFAFLLGSDAAKTSRATGHFADFGTRSAKSKALNEARQQADSKYKNCVVCENGCCKDCLDAEGICRSCVDKSAKPGGRTAESRPAGGQACPNCSTPGSGGRFCAECGFDMASTHKSCPGCGSLAERASRFCRDCGHGF